MATRKTEKAWKEYLDQAGRELTLDEFAAQETAHICANTIAAHELAARTLIATERINGRLDRLELWLAQNAKYPTTQTHVPNLAALRASGIPE